MPLVAFLLALFLLGGCATPPTAVGPTVDPFSAYLMAGDRLAASGRRMAAEEIYRQAAALRPADPVPYLRLAHLYQTWERPREGQAAVEAAARLGAPTLEVESLRAAFCADLGDWEGVISHGSAVLQSDPSDQETRRRLAQAYVALGEVEKAIGEYEVLQRSAPGDPQIGERLGVLLAMREPEAAWPYLQAARTPLATGVLQVLEEGGETAYRLARIGQVCLAHGEPWLAALALEQAVALQPAYADAQALLGEALRVLGREEEALAHLTAAVEAAPQSALAQSLLGLHYLEAGEPRSARPYLEAAYDLDPANPAFSLYLARVYAALGWHDVAGAWADEALRLAPDDPDMWEAVARLYLEYGMTDRGVEAARRLAELRPDDGVAYDLLGWAYFLNGDRHQAEVSLLQAVRLSPGLGLAYCHLGQLYSSVGDRERARMYFIRALDLPIDQDLRERIEGFLDMPDMP